jgi:hypothetical protein
MKKLISTLAILLIIISALNAQYYKLITVPSGTKIIEKFPPSVRYLYPQFTVGKLYTKSGDMTDNTMNFNLLTGEIELLKNKDTVVFARKKDISLITMAQDTFVYRNEYLQQIHGGKIVVLERDMINLKEMVKKGAMGQPNRSSQVDSFNSMNYKSNMYLINPDEDMEFRRELQFYLLNSGGEMVEIRKKTLPDLFPGKEVDIQKYLKANKINFEMKDDIIKLADFLSGL